MEEADIVGASGTGPGQEDFIDIAAVPSDSADTVPSVQVPVDGDGVIAGLSVQFSFDDQAGEG